MRLIPAPGRILLLFLALVLGAVKCPAEGLTFFEQREAFPRPVLPQLRPDRTQLILNLSGQWEVSIGDKTPELSTWLPGCYSGEPRELQFSRSFNLPDSLAKWNFQLILPEVNYALQVWINNRLVSSFAGGHLSFSCDVGHDLLRFNGPNEIVLKVSDELSPTASLPLSRQLLQPMNFGGFPSGVYLRGVPNWSIEGAKLVQRSSESLGMTSLDVSVRIAHYASQSTQLDSVAESALQIYVSVRDSTGELMTETRRDLAGRSAEEAFQMTVSLPSFSPDLWSPDAPTLYELTVALLAESDTVHQLVRTVGFKQLDIRGGNIFLNGSRLRVRGMDYIPEPPSGDVLRPCRKWSRMLRR